MQETGVQSLDWEDPLEKGLATHSSILAWIIPRIEEPGGHKPRGHKKLDMTEQLSTFDVHALETFRIKVTYFI